MAHVTTDGQVGFHYVDQKLTLDTCPSGIVLRLTGRDATHSAELRVILNICETVRLCETLPAALREYKSRIAVTEVPPAASPGSSASKSRGAPRLVKTEKDS